MKKQFLSFIGVCAYSMGTIGGFGFSAWGGSWPVAISVLILAIMAWPTAKKLWNNMSD